MTVRLKLGQKIFGAVAVVITGLVATSSVLLSGWISTETHQRLRQDLDRARSVLVEFMEERQRRLATLCGSVAESPRLKAAIAEQDAATATDQATAERSIIGVDIIVIVGRDGGRLAAVGPCEIPDEHASRATLDEARAGRLARALWRVGDRLFLVAAHPIKFEEELAGAIAIGDEVDDGDVREIQRMTQSEVLYVLGLATPGPSTLAPGLKAAALAGGKLAGVWSPSGGPTDVTLAGRRHLVLGSPLSAAGKGMSTETQGAVFLLRDLDGALAHLRGLQFGLVGVGACALIVVLLVSLALVRTITGPVDALVRGAQAVGQGDLDTPIEAGSSDEIGVLAQRFEEMRVNLRRSIDQLKDAERMQRDLELARTIQLSLLPRVVPSIPGVGLAAHCSPANAVGGDYYDWMVTADGRLSLWIVDVSGHSVGSALMMAMVRSVLRTLTSSGLGPAGVLSGACVQLHDDLVAAELFFSAFHARFDPATRLLEYASAGHNPPLWVTGEPRTVRPLSPDGMLIGLMPDTEFAQESITMQPGDLLVLYTDGIVEAVDTAAAAYGDERLAVRLAAVGLVPRTAVDGVLEDLKSHLGGVVPSDDLTLLALGT